MYTLCVFTSFKGVKLFLYTFCCKFQSIGKYKPGIFCLRIRKVGFYTVFINTHIARQSHLVFILFDIRQYQIDIKQDLGTLGSPDGQPNVPFSWQSMLAVAIQYTPTIPETSLI